MATHTPNASKNFKSLHAGDILVASASFMDAMDGKKAGEVPKGTAILVSGFDQDDDVNICLVEALEGDRCRIRETTAFLNDLEQHTVKLIKPPRCWG